MGHEHLETTLLSAALLGGFHGLNPAMGWLFAVFLGLQRKSQSALLLALLPITVGHATAVAAVALLIFLAQSTLPIGPVRLATAGLLLGFGLYKLLTLTRHSRWVGLNIRTYELAWWSLLVATAHGSGLMLAPLILGLSSATATFWLLLIHNAAMVGVMAGMALIVYQKLGVAALQRIWINFHLLWVIALLMVGVIALAGLLIAPAH